MANMGTKGVFQKVRLGALMNTAAGLRFILKIVSQNVPA